MITVAICILLILILWLSTGWIRTIAEYREHLTEELAWLDKDKEYKDWLLSAILKVRNANPLYFMCKWRCTFNLPIRDTLTTPSKEEKDLALSLIIEEMNELLEASKNEDVIKIADGIGDLIWVTHQLACIYGIDVAKVIQEIYKSNMSKVCYSEKESIEREDCNYMKVNVDGKDGFILFRKSDGKVQKPSTFIEPDLKTVLRL